MFVGKKFVADVGGNDDDEIGTMVDIFDMSMSALSFIAADGDNVDDDDEHEVDVGGSEGGSGGSGGATLDGDDKNDETM